METYNIITEEAWIDLRDNCPKAFDHFTEWLTRYKKEVHYTHLFNNGGLPFWLIPKDMQIGIVMRYLADATSDIDGYNDLQLRLSADICDTISNLHK